MNYPKYPAFSTKLQNSSITNTNGYLSKYDDSSYGLTSGPVSSKVSTGQMSKSSNDRSCSNQVYGFGTCSTRYNTKSTGPQ